MKLFGVTTTYNEGFIVPYVMKYAEALGYDKLIVFDNGSTDNTVELLKQYPFVEVRTYDTDCFCEMSKISVKVDAIFELREQCEGDIAWCTQCDFDEVFFMIPGFASFKDYLAYMVMNGYNVCTETMFMCMSSGFPLKDYLFLHEQIDTVAYQCPQTFNKANLFRLDTLTSMNIFPGSHQCGFDYGDYGVRQFYNTKALCAFHLKFAFGKDYIMNRTRELNKRKFKKFEESEEGDVCSLGRMNEFFDGLYKYAIPIEDYFKHKILNGNDSYEHDWSAYKM